MIFLASIVKCITRLVSDVCYNAQVALVMHSRTRDLSVSYDDEADYDIGDLQDGPGVVRHAQRRRSCKSCTGC